MSSASEAQLGATFAGLLQWALQPELANQLAWRLHGGSDAAGAATRLAHLEQLQHEAAELHVELRECLPPAEVGALSLALSRAVRDAQRAVLVEQEIEAQEARRWRRARPSDGPSIDDFAGLVKALPGFQARARSPRSRRTSAPRQADAGEEGPGDDDAAGGSPA